MKICCTFFLAILCVLTLNSFAQKTFKLNIGTTESFKHDDAIYATNHDIIVATQEGSGLILSLVTRLNANGLVKWSKNFPVTNARLATTNDNGFLLCGNLQTGTRFLIKCDSNCNVQWSKVINSRFSLRLYEVFLQSASGDYYFSDGDFDSYLYLIKINKNGDVTWSKTFTNISIGWGFYPALISELKNNNFVLSVAVNACSFTCTNLELIKFDSSGNYNSYMMNTSGNYKSPIPLTIDNINNRADGIFAIKNDTALNYAYMDIDFDNLTASCKTIPYNIFSLQYYARSNHLDKIKNKPLNNTYEFSTVVFNNDWSMININTLSPYFSTSVYKYDSLGRICPDYTVPQIKKGYNAANFTLSPINIPLHNNKIITVETIVTGTDDAQQTMLCTGLPSLYAFPN